MVTATVTELSMQGTGQPHRQNNQPCRSDSEKVRKRRLLMTSEKMRATATGRAWAGQKRG